LKEYHEISKEYVERAYQADVQGARSRAVELYNKALEVMEEALVLPVVTSGLGALASNVTLWRKELLSWQEHVINRKRDLETEPASTSAGRAQANVRSHRGVEPSVTPPKGSFTRMSRIGKGSGTAQRAKEKGRGVLGGVKRAATGALEAVKKESDKYRQIIMAEVLVVKPKEQWDDISGLQFAKQALHESVILPTLRSDLFRGLRSPPRGLLLYGPPGNGKTLLAKALASEAKATFFNISASSLTSKWVGEGEKLVRALFEVANEKQPAIIFIDEIDSILSSRSATENDAMRRLKTEFLVQFDGVASQNDRVVVIGATNRPQELDDAARRRLVKRIYIPLPDAEARCAIIEHLFKDQAHVLTRRDVDRLVAVTDGYSGSDLTALCKEASMVAIRELGSEIRSVQEDSVRPVALADFHYALGAIRPSVNREMLRTYEEFTAEFGTQ